MCHRAEAEGRVRGKRDIEGRVCKTIEILEKSVHLLFSIRRPVAKEAKDCRMN